MNKDEYKYLRCYENDSRLTNSSRTTIMLINASIVSASSASMLRPRLTHLGAVLREYCTLRHMCGMPVRFIEDVATVYCCIGWCIYYR